jgi:SGT1 protein
MTPAESFNLPKEFEGFVSSADDLLQQFQRLDTEDAVKVQIYSDKRCTQAESLDLLDKLSAFIEKVSETYIWFKDSLKITLIVPDDKKDFAHFCGVVKFSDSIEDEWFVTFIALRLSEAFPNISICVTDTDGQFLLIEAADFIPDWIDPENCENRLWIRQGKVHIVALDEAGRNIHDCGIKLNAALEAVRNRPNDTVASRHVQAAIAQVKSL